MQAFSEFLCRDPYVLSHFDLVSLVLVQDATEKVSQTLNEMAVELIEEISYIMFSSELKEAFFQWDAFF